jgi:formylglycine-generating enzyme
MRRSAVVSGRTRDALLAGPLLAVMVGLVQAAPPTGSPTSILPHQCPTDMARVGDVCVDKWEASLVEVMPNGNEVPWSPYHSPHGHHVRALSKPGVVPQGYISMQEAKKACEASNKRLCRANEWRAACRGPNKTLYPYGQTHVPSACTDTNRTAPLSKLYSGKAMFENKNMIDPRLNQFPNTVAKTGEATACTNTYGAFDMVGNLHEWTDDGMMHGGFYLDTKTLHEGCEYTTSAHSPVYYDYATGFRCCADPTDAPEQAKSKTSGKKVAKR